MPVPPSCRSKPPAAPATPSVCSSSLERRLVRAAACALPLLALVLYARSFWGSPAFGELADQGYHLELGHAFAEAWRAGEFPPTWSASANGGRGSPAFLLYPPLFPWLTACWMRFLGPTPEALRWSAFTPVLFNFFSIYWAARGWLSRPRACAAAGVALLLPGVTFVALGRGMFPNFLALGWVAIAAGAGQRAIARRSYLAVLALAAAGLLLTHMPTAYLAALLGVTVAIALRKPCGARTVVAGALAGISALLVTGWFWGPMLLVASQAQTGYLAEAHPYVESLWWTASAPETPFERDWAFLNDAAARLGAAQLALAAGLILALPRGPLRCALTLAAAWTAFASLWPTGAWLASLPYYESVQFCWRWQPLLTLGCAFAFASLPARTVLRFALAVAAAAGLFLPLASPSDQRPGETPSVASNLIEMRPLGAGRELFPPGAAGRFETLSADCSAALIDLRPSRRIYRVSAGAPCLLRVLTYHFPGWRATLDGMPLEVRAERETALQLLDIPAGTHEVELRYEPGRAIRYFCDQH